jgi:hypothetical protein
LMPQTIGVDAPGFSVTEGVGVAAWAGAATNAPNKEVRPSKTANPRGIILLITGLNTTEGLCRLVFNTAQA